MIIDTTYFVYKPVFIPNVTNNPDTTGNTPSLKNELQAFIDEREYHFLVSVLGLEQYTELKSQLNADGTFIVDPMQKWVDFVDGKVSDNWKGLRYTVGTTKHSLMAYYVFFYYLGEDYSRYTTTGMVMPQVANSTVLHPNDKQVKVWNQFLMQYGGYRNGNVGYSFFENWNGMGMMWNGSDNRNNEVTLYDFMQKNTDVYDNSFFTYQRPLNNLML